MKPSDSITQIRGIGPSKASVLKSDAGISTVEDLLYYIPRRYIDRSSFKKIKDCFVNEVITVAGTIVNKRIAGRRKKRLEIVISDGTDSLSGIFFGGLSYFDKIFDVNDYVLFSGKINFFNEKQIVHPDFDFIDTDGDHRGINTGRIVPLYPSTEKLKRIGLDSRGFRRMIKTVIDACLSCITDSIDQAVLDDLKLTSLTDALSGIHFPESFEHAEQSRRRLAFNEIFFLQYYLSLSRRFIQENCTKKTAPVHHDAVPDFISSLPFKLTEDQERAVKEITNDLSRPFPMNRLLQGDVGSGKTVVSVAASVYMCSAGQQTALMAPTEVLAQQHFSTYNRFLGSSCRIALITGSTPAAEKQYIYKGCSSGTIDIVIGTHALIQDSVSFKDLGLIIIDEQHRFGVNQRSSLRQKGADADLLIMTATPIPRSLSLTLYGDLDVTIIKMKPADRVPIKTLVFPETKINGVYRSLEKYMSQGRQVYYVLPLIEESEQSDLKSAVQTYEKLGKDIFPQRKLALLHGRMKNDEKNSIMESFKAGDIDMLVTTTVIEVGIDIPNATVIVIEHAERFGLSQLHQLRGRVGRGEHQSFCVLIHPDEISQDGRDRLAVLLSTDDGFIISEEDLKMRGSGEILGQRQHGHAGDFEFTNLSQDVDLIVKARDLAAKTVARIDNTSLMIQNFNDRKYEHLIDGIRKKRVLSILS